MACCQGALGYATPGDATRGPREEVLFVVAVALGERPDYLATVDVKAGSDTYSQVIHRTPVPYKDDELHHSGWNACSSCFGDDSKSRKYLVLPALKSGRVYGFDVETDPRAPTLGKIVEPAEIQEKTGLAYLHSSHCLGSGEIVISAMGDPQGHAKGGFVLLDGETFEVKGTWAKETTEFGYDFWYQPHHDVLVSTSWGAPEEFFKGFDPSQVPTKYGDLVYIWSWKDHELKQKIHLGPDGLIPLEVRALHDPWKPTFFVGAALSSNVIRLDKAVNGDVSWKPSVAIRQEWTKVEGWVLPELPPLITDIIISLDDKFIFFSNWLRGDLVQYDISDPLNPKFVSRVWLGGLIKKGSPLKVTGGLPEDTPEAPEVPLIQGREIRGGPQMLQLSLDGKRLYVTTSLFSPWDKQFYPELLEKGAQLLLVDVTEDGLQLNQDFLVDFGDEPEGPALAHEIRYPGGDCSSDIWVVETDPEFKAKAAAEGAAAH
ncbi:Selenium-binding 1 [Micractinium conductrix]|uniref:Selenium-binding 1 n=1 Tax=Micractinium conductrix TaxID=554055 RepID=A0A2P6V4K6_9CHLO|nr:Selenium-binding 1 [Micractinium conductrix]|eukprot:PSC69022.1 Selenium-binding 1 [Micractinium conductrix]